MQLRVTRKLEKSLEVSVSQANTAVPASPMPCEFAGFDCWTAKDFVWDGHPYLLFMDRAWKLTYDYDFGDGWEHNLIRESVDPNATLLHPKPLGGKGLAPEEDSGGIGGHLANLRASGIAINAAAEKDIGSHMILI